MSERDYFEQFIGQDDFLDEVWFKWYAVFREGYDSYYEGMYNNREDAQAYIDHWSNIFPEWKWDIVVTEHDEPQSWNRCSISYHTRSFPLWYKYPELAQKP